ncbi:Obg-like ATPase, partial [Ascosphaera acerosa]
LLNTRNGSYAAACALDFAHARAFYDSFALRDLNGKTTYSSAYPYLSERTARNALGRGEPVPVQSCWNGLAVFDAAPFTPPPPPASDGQPLRFRGISDSLAAHHVEGSECCLIHYDNPLTRSKGVWVNPHVRVGYNAAARASVDPAAGARFPSRSEAVGGWLWSVLAAATGLPWRNGRIGREVSAWRREAAGNDEPGKRLDSAPQSFGSTPIFSYASKRKKKTSQKRSQHKEDEEKALLGRPGNNLKSGIVGLANVGKSTLFQAITKSTLGNPANFPFATIDPEEARVIVPDARYDWLCEHYKPKSKVPANLTVYDIAGLTRGASAGAGLGNAFLSHIRAVDAIFQVVRCFDDAEIIHVEGNVDPIRDLEIIAEELRIKDIDYVERHLESLSKLAKRPGQSLELRKLQEEEAIVQKVLQYLQDGNDVRKADWTAKEVEVINKLLLLTAKPVVYLINLSEQDYVAQGQQDLPRVARVAEWIQANSPGSPVIPLSVSFEERLTQLQNEAEVEEVCKRVGARSALPQVITTMRSALNLSSFFTVGPDEVRQWTIRKGTKAPGAAGVIHTDLEKTFIQCLAFNYSALKEHGDEAAVKAAGKVMTKGKDYVIEDGDILLVKAGAAKS